jgi:hypothetical protein
LVPGSTGLVPGADRNCAYFRDANYGGFSDWRGPTLKEVQTALANGLHSHLDYFDDGGVTPDDGVYRWTSCQVNKGKGTVATIRFADGHTVNRDHNALNTFQICVRGKPRTDDCGAGKKNNKGLAAATFHSQPLTTALLLSPLGLVFAARCVPPRRP